METQKRKSREPTMLRCENNPSCGDFVLHNFSKTRACTIKNESGILQETNEELYICTKCGKARRWGIVPQIIQEKIEEIVENICVIICTNIPPKFTLQN